MSDAGYTPAVAGWLEDELLRRTRPPNATLRSTPDGGPSARVQASARTQDCKGPRCPTPGPTTAHRRSCVPPRWSDELACNAGILNDPDDFESDRGSLMATRSQLELRESSRAHGSPRCRCSNTRTLRRPFSRIQSPAHRAGRRRAPETTGTYYEDSYAPDLLEARHDEPCRSETRRSSWDADGWTDDNALTQRYDTYKVDAITNEIAGEGHSGGAQARRPSLFGIASGRLHRGKADGVRRKVMRLWL
jgi:hypothetical protein